MTTAALPSPCDWLDERYRRFAVFGLGTSGVAAANLLARLGRQVIASDTRSIEALRAQHAGVLHPSVRLVGGGNDAGDAQIVVLSLACRPVRPCFSGCVSLAGRCC